MAVNIQSLKNKIVSEAKSERGYKEGRNNWNKFAVEANAGWVQNAPWCGTFNVAIYKRAGINLLKIISNPFYVPTMEREGKQKGIWVSNSNIEAGDLVLYEFNGDSLRDHTGISIGGSLTVEGNTSNGMSGSQADGGGVFQRNRGNATKRGALSLRLMAQKFPNAFNNKVENIKLEVWEKSARIKSMNKETVKDLQNKLVKAGYSVGKSGVDGSYKKDTTTAVINFQKKYKLTADGVAGPNTIAKLNEVLKGSTTNKPSKPAAKPVVKPKPAAKPVKDLIKVDGRFGSSTVKRFQRFLNARGAKLKVDGKAGHNFWKALQTYLGTTVDGVISNQSHKAKSLGNGITQGWKYTGPNSKGSTMVKALQKWVGVKQDGVWGEATTTAVQKKLNAHA